MMIGEQTNDYYRLAVGELKCYVAQCIFCDSNNVTKRGE